MILNPWQLSQCLYVKYNELLGDEKWAGKKRGARRRGKRRERMSTNEDELTLMLLSSRQSVFWGSRFTKQIWERERDTQSIIVTSRFYHKSCAGVDYEVPRLCHKSNKPGRMIAFLWVTHHSKTTAGVCRVWITTVRYCLSLAELFLRRCPCLSGVASSRCKLSLSLFFRFPLPLLPLFHSASVTLGAPFSSHLTRLHLWLQV